MHLTRRTLAIASLAAALALPLSACGDGESAEPAPSGDQAKPIKPTAGVDLSGKDFSDETGSAKVAVQARDNTFVAPYIEVKAGTIITFTNKGRNQHNVYPTTEGAFPIIDTDAFDPGESGVVKLNKPGDYPYYCTLHGTKTKGMVGAIRVVS